MNGIYRNNNDRLARLQVISFHFTLGTIASPKSHYTAPSQVDRRPASGRAATRGGGQAVRSRSAGVGAPGGRVRRPDGSNTGAGRRLSTGANHSRDVLDGAGSLVHNRLHCSVDGPGRRTRRRLHAHTLSFRDRAIAPVLILAQLNAASLVLLAMVA